MDNVKPNQVRCGVKITLPEEVYTRRLKEQFSLGVDQGQMELIRVLDLYASGQIHEKEIAVSFRDPAAIAAFNRIVEFLR
jgi:hypothetical protein